MDGDGHVQPLGDEARQFRRAFESALQNGVGAQRAGLLLEIGRDWLEKQFNTEGTEPKTFSVLRRPDGSYSVSAKSGSHWLSVGVPSSHAENLTYYVPAHLLPLFTNVSGLQPP